MKHAALFVAALSFAAASLAADGAKNVMAAGKWGGAHLRIELTADGGKIEFDCAHGSIDVAPTTDDSGAFDLSGTFVPERGGPVRRGEEAPKKHARYRGTVKGEEMTLTVEIEGVDKPAGPYTLRHGGASRLWKCL